MRKKRKIKQIVGKKRKNPIDRMKLSEEDDEKWDNFKDKIRRIINSEKEMKYKDNTLIFILENLLIKLKENNDYIEGVSESLDDIIDTLKELKKILD